MAQVVLDRACTDSTTQPDFAGVLHEEGEVCLASSRQLTRSRVGTWFAECLAMRTLSITIPALISTVLVGCGDDSTTINITTSGRPFALVAFRDGMDANWQPATMETIVSFKAHVHGPYAVAVVCEDLPGGQGSSTTLATQAARTLDDPRDLAFCGVPPDEPAVHVTGHMVQAGSVQIANQSDESLTPDWDFDLAVAPGSYDLVATTRDGVAVRRGIIINGALALTPPIDVVKDGMPLADVAFTAPNATDDETTAASVGLSTASNSSLAQIYEGLLATAKAAPEAVLIDTDVQSVLVSARTATTLRTVRRPFRVGGDTVYTLPDPIEGARWSVDGGKLSVAWASMPEFDTVSAESVGQAADGTTLRNAIDLSASYVAATGITSTTIDTDIPGFKPMWKVDLDGSYRRDLTAQKSMATSTVVTSGVNELVEHK